MSGLDRIEDAEMLFLAIVHNPRDETSCLCFSDAFQSCLIGLAYVTVLHALPRRCFSQIVNPIVTWRIVFMVYESIRPSTVNIEPRQPMGRVILVVDFDY